MAFGFTTVPLFGPDGGVWYPIGLYYLTRGSARFEAWGKATLVIAGATGFCLKSGPLCRKIGLTEAYPFLRD